MGRKTGRIWPWYVLAALLVGADQLVKFLVRTHMAVGQQRPFIPYILELYHIRNTGGAFSLFAGHTWVLAIISAVATLALALAMSSRRWFRGILGRTAGTLLLAGAVGNLIDRVAFGYVTDMFNFTFMTFGIFNVADICVVVGVGVLVIYFWRQSRKETEDGADPADSRP